MIVALVILVVFLLVALALLWRRYCVNIQTLSNELDRANTAGAWLSVERSLERKISAAGTARLREQRGAAEEECARLRKAVALAEMECTRLQFERDEALATAKTANSRIRMLEADLVAADEYHKQFVGGAAAKREELMAKLEDTQRELDTTRREFMNSRTIASA